MNSYVETKRKNLKAEFIEKVEWWLQELGNWEKKGEVGKSVSTFRYRSEDLNKVSLVAILYYTIDISKESRT